MYLEGKQLTHMNIPLNKEGELYANSSRMGGKLCLLIGVRSFSLLKDSLRSRGKSLTLLYLVIYVHLSTYNICLVLYNR
jgi:hypothetical protein